MDKLNIFKMKYVPNGGMIDFHRDSISLSEVGTPLMSRHIIEAYEQLKKHGISINDITVVRYQSEFVGDTFKEAGEAPLNELLKEIQD